MKEILTGLEQLMTEMSILGELPSVCIFFGPFFGFFSSHEARGDDLEKMLDGNTKMHINSVNEHKKLN